MKKTAAVFALYLAFVVASNAALAESVSGGGMTAWTTADAPYITHQTYGVYNADTTSSRYVTGSLGTFTIGSSSTVARVSISGKNNGGTQTCWVNYTKVGQTTDPSWIGSTGTTVNGVFNYEVDVTIPANNSSEYAVALICLLPATTGNVSSYMTWAGNPFS